MSVLVLCYHNINYSKRIDPDLFESHLKILKEAHFEPVRLIDIYNYIMGNITIPKKSVHITFDDGYADNFIYAYPLIKKYKFYATIFAIVNKISFIKCRATFNELVKMRLSDSVNEFITKSPYVSWNELEEMKDSKFFEIGSHSLNHRACFASTKLLKFNDSHVGNWFYELTNDKRLGIPVYEKKWNCAVGCLKDDVQLRNYLADYVSNRNGLLFFKNKHANRELLKQFKAYIKKNPKNFKRESTNDRLVKIEQEIKDSKTILESKLNCSIDFFAYPWGDFDALSIRALKEAGYKGGLTLMVGLNSRTTYPYLMRRVEARGEYDWLKKRLIIYSNNILASLYSKIYHKL